MFSAAVFAAAHTAPAAQEPHDELLHFSGKQQEVSIAKVPDSDRLVLTDGRTIKLIGIESAGMPPRPEVKRDKNGMIVEEPQDSAIPLEEQAIAYARGLLEGKKVKLEFDVDAQDADGRRLAYVFLPDGTLANAQLLRQGFVHLKIRPPNVKYAEELRQAYRQAKTEQRGFMSN